MFKFLLSAALGAAADADRQQFDRLRLQREEEERRAKMPDGKGGCRSVAKRLPHDDPEAVAVAKPVLSDWD